MPPRPQTRPPDRAPAAADVVLDALGNDVRRQMLRLLRERPRTVGDLAAVLPVSRPAVSKHLRVLEAADLVAFDSAGTRSVYRVAGDGFGAARDFLDAFWDDALARFALVAENTTSTKKKPP